MLEATDTPTDKSECENKGSQDVTANGPNAVAESLRKPRHQIPHRVCSANPAKGQGQTQQG